MGGVPGPATGAPPAVRGRFPSFRKDWASKGGDSRSCSEEGGTDEAAASAWTPLRKPRHKRAAASFAGGRVFHGGGGGRVGNAFAE